VQTKKRDVSVAIEKKYQKLWQDEKIWESDLPPAETGLTMNEMKRKYPKFFGCMAYPYMNGSLHLGHAFSLSKIEFMTRFERMQGKNVLFPLGFHCTGMPIKVCALFMYD
jgi:leucyl-tRNA synthetase